MYALINSYEFFRLQFGLSFCFTPGLLVQTLSEFYIIMNLLKLAD